MEIEVLGAAIRPSLWLQGISKFANQDQDQHDDHYEAKSTAAIVAGSVEAASADAAKAAE
jgi:hypothetical protein